MKGCLLIRSNKTFENDTRDFYRLLFGDSLLFEGRAFSDKFSAGTNVDISTEVGAFAVSDDEIYEMPVPTRGSVILTCFSGTISDLCKVEVDNFTDLKDPQYEHPAYCAGKMLLHLNSSKHKDDLSSETSNYADLLKSRVTDKLDGSWTLTLAYLALSGRCRITVARKLRDIYFHFISAKGFDAIVWTDNLTVFEKLDPRFFTYSMTPLYEKEVLVFHPLYIIDKWKRWSSQKQKGNNFAAIAVLEKYLERAAR